MTLFTDESKPKSKRRQAKESIEIYYDRVLPTLNKRQMAVMQIFARYRKPMTAKEVASAMGVQLNTISGRFGELRKMEDGQGNPFPFLIKTGKRREDSAEHTFTKEGLEAFYLATEKN